MSEKFGKFELLKRIGGGGMGEVFLAKHHAMAGFSHLVVVKTLLPSLEDDDTFIKMFLDEARLASRLYHQNVCTIHDLGQQGGVLYIAMEYIRGENLEKIQQDAAAAGSALPPALSVRIIADALAGLAHAHSLNDDAGKTLQVIHRDVAPPNLMVTWDGEVELLDFGLARARNRFTKTQGGVLKGRFAYMAPEQVVNEDIDHRIDIFAVGVVLHELLTGQRLFRKDTDMATLAAVATAQAPAPSTINPDLPKELDAIVLKALNRDRNQRYPDATAFRLALEEYLRHSREPSSGVHLMKFMQQLYKDRINVERTHGPAWDAPEGPVSSFYERTKDLPAEEEAPPAKSMPKTAPATRIPTAQLPAPAAVAAPAKEAGALPGLVWAMIGAAAGAGAMLALLRH